MTAQDTIRTRAKELLESGEVATFIGWEAGRFANQTTPLVITDAADADKLVFDEYCVNTLAKYVRDTQGDTKPQPHRAAPKAPLEPRSSAR